MNAIEKNHYMQRAQVCLYARELFRYPYAYKSICIDIIFGNNYCFPFGVKVARASCSALKKKNWTTDDGKSDERARIAEGHRFINTYVTRIVL